MGDYVLESNPALERLIERFGAHGEPPSSVERSGSSGSGKRSWRERRSNVHAAGHPGVLEEAPMAAGAKERVERATAGSPAAVAEEDPEAVEHDLWALEEDLESADEMLLVDFDEEPAVFDEDPDLDDDGADEADEILDLYEDEDLDDEQYGDEDRGIVDRGAEILDDKREERGDWIFRAFEAWMLDAGEDRTVRDDEDLEAFDQYEADADDFIDVFDEGDEDPVWVAQSPHEKPRSLSPG